MLPALQTFLPMAEKIYNKKTTLDILQYICITNGKMIYTDLENTITMPVSDKRSFTLSVSILKKVLSTKPQSLKIYSLDNSRVSISYENKQVTFSSANVEEYPNLPGESFQEMGMWDCEIFKKLHKQIPFASTDNLRPALCGIYVKQEKSKLASVATDGHVLQYITSLEVKSKNKFENVVPVTPIKLVSRFNRGDVKIGMSEKYVRFTFNNNIEITSRLINEGYPNFKRVIPEMNGNEIILEKKEILKCIKSALPFSNTNNHQGTFRSNNGHIRIKVDDTEENTSFESSFEVVNKKGNELHQALNLQLLEKTVKALEEERLHWHYSDPDNASVFTNGNGGQNLIMPVRLKGEET